MNLQRALEEQKQQTAPDVQQIPGLLGIPLNGQRRVEVAGRNAYVYVRLRANQNEVMQAYNNQVAPAYNLPVLLERQGNKYIVIGVDTARYENNWTSQSPFLPRHGNTHSFDLESGGAGDIVWVQSRQIVPALVFPSGSVGADSVIINPYVLKNSDGTWRYVGNTGTSSLAPYRPTGSNALMALVYLDASSGNPYFLINSGSVFSNTLTGTSQIVPYIPQVTNPGTQIPLAAIRLITGTSQISWDNIYDVRQWLHTINTGSAAAGGSVGIQGIPVQDEGVFVATGSVLNFVGDNVSASVSGSVIRVYVTGSASGGINTGTLDARYLKLDTSNDPLYGALNLSGTAIILADQSGVPLYLQHEHWTGSASVLVVDQYAYGEGESASTLVDLYRYPVAWNAPKIISPIISASETSYSGTIYGKFATLLSDNVERVSLHPHATGTIQNYIYDTSRTRPTGTIHTQWKVNNNEIARLDVSGTIYSNNSPLIKEAPVDGQSYVRKSAGWEVGGDYALLADTLLGADTGSVDWQNISQAYKHLKIVFDVRSSIAGVGSAVGIRFNNDSGNNYNSYGKYWNYNNAEGNYEGILSSSGFIASTTGNTSPAGHSAVSEAVISNYTGTTFFKNWVAPSFNPSNSGSGGPYIYYHGGHWISTNAVTRITLIEVNGADFKAGSRFTLYGMR